MKAALPPEFKVKSLNQYHSRVEANGKTDLSIDKGGRLLVRGSQHGL
jgi:hypothetical protein